MTSQTVVLVTGANRGLGRAVAEHYLARPNHTVIAANRDPSHPTSQELLNAPKHDSSVLHVIKVDATKESDPAVAVKDLQGTHKVDHIDIVFANAGIVYCIPKVSELKISELRDHMEPNVYGVVWLYQAVLPLMKRSKEPKWISMGSASGCLTNFLAFPNAAYGITKVALHWITCAIHTEEPEITALVIDPGRVQTDMGNRGARAAAELFGIPDLTEAELPINVSVPAYLKIVDSAKRETHSGKLWSWEGKVVPW